MVAASEAARVQGKGAEAMAGGPRVVTRGRALAAVVLLMALTAGALRAWGRSSGPSLWTVSVGHGPVALAVDERRARVFVANNDDATVSVLDARSGTVLATRAVGLWPHALAVDEVAGRVFVLDTNPGNGADSVSVLDARSGERLGTSAVGRGASALAVDARTGHVFVANTLDNTVSVLAAASGHMSIVRTVAVVLSPVAVAVDAATERAFVVSRGALDYSGPGAGAAAGVC
jgi:YVTN family beta-propeller protein